MLTLKKSYYLVDQNKLVMAHTTLDQRKFIERKSKEGEKALNIAQELGISIWTVLKWRYRLKKGGLLLCHLVVLESARWGHLVANFVSA